MSTQLACAGNTPGLVLHCRTSLRGTRTATVSPAVLVRLHASPCDFVWVTHTSGGGATLLKLVAEAAAADGLLLVGEDTLSELRGGAGDAVRALVVCAGAVQPWAELELLPVGGCTTAPLPSAVRPPSSSPILTLALAGLGPTPDPGLTLSRPKCFSG